MLFHIYFLFQAAIFDFSLTPTKGPYLDQSSRIAGHRKLSITVGMLCLSCVQAEIYVISYLPPVSGHHLWFLTHSIDKRQYLNQPSRVAWHWKHRYSRWNFVAIMCTSWFYTLFHIYFLFQAAIFDCSLILKSSCIRPTVLLNAKYMRILLKFHMYSICNVRCKCFRFYVRHFYFRLNSYRIVYKAMLLSAAVTSASLKANTATLNLLPKAIYALWFSGHQVYHIFTKKSSTAPSLPVT